MSQKNKHIILLSYKEKLLRSIILLRASLHKVQPFDENKDYTFDELEPYDALSDRFIRTVEVAIKFFRSYQIYNEAITSETLRELLLYSEKQGLITKVDIWFEMREVRNQIVHDYLPDQQKMLYDDIINSFAKEIEFLQMQVENKIK